MSRRSTIFVESDPDLDCDQIVKHRAELLIRGSFDDQTPDYFQLLTSDVQHPSHLHSDVI